MSISLKMMILALLFSGCSISWAQTDPAYRGAYTLKLPVDSEGFYEQGIAASPYFVKDKVLQLYPGEKVFVETETNGNEIVSMKVVKDNLNPGKTLVIEFTQKVTDRKSDMMLLKVFNPFKEALDYKALMFTVGHDKWKKTKVLPVPAKMAGYESWNEVIITLVLKDWKFK